MIGYITVSVVSGILFGILDGVIYTNPLAQSLHEVYKPSPEQIQTKQTVMA